MLATQHHITSVTLIGLQTVGQRNAFHGAARQPSIEFFTLDRPLVYQQNEKTFTVSTDDSLIPLKKHIEKYLVITSKKIDAHGNFQTSHTSERTNYYSVECKAPNADGGADRDQGVQIIIFF